jgi:hypothetical protein
MPGYSCSIKERMLYSSCKAPLLESIQTQTGLPIIKKVQYMTIYVKKKKVYFSSIDNQLKNIMKILR